MDLSTIDLGARSSHTFMKYRIKRILLVCCSYDGYTLEEDGHIDSQINREYAELNMSNPPSLTRVKSTAAALEMLNSGEQFDFVLTMFNIGEPDVFEFSKLVKDINPNLPVILLTSFNKEVYRQIEEHKDSCIDQIFCWHGNSDLIIAIIKLMEDRLNAEEDIYDGGVQAIMLVEDSVRFYSTYLPELYRILLIQNTRFLKDGFNEQQIVARKRARPKVLLATCYAEAVEMYEKYKNNLLGVISDVGMVVHKGDPSDTEKLDAGLDLCRMIQQETPWMPLIIQSSQIDYKKVADGMGVNFIAKSSKTLLADLRDVMFSRFGFGDLIFKDPKTGIEVGRASDLTTLQELLKKTPDEILEYQLSRMSLSKWLNCRGLFPIAKVLRKIKSSDFKSTAEHRDALVHILNDYRILLGQGIVASFDPESYSDVVGFAKIGEGSIGGKARGLAFMNTMLAKYRYYYKYPNVRMLIPRSVVVAADCFEEFIQLNGLDYIISQDIPDDIVLEEFLNSVMPENVYEKLKVFVKTCTKPVAVRSSSKLEDSHYQPFAGVYSTYMIPRCEDDDQMLRLLARAIKSVYASTYFASSKAYVQSTQNLLSEEKMAVLIQEVCGTTHGDCFYPTLSGVARSENMYTLGYEEPGDGVCNMVMGLGKAVVDGERSLRFCPAYPDKALQTSTPELATRDAQNEIFALSLKSSDFRPSTDDAVNLKRLTVSEVAKGRNAKHVCSYFDFQGNRITETPPMFGPTIPVITFNKILKYNTFPLAQIIRDLLEIGREEMQCEVEIEFAADLDVENGERSLFNLLQIRPIHKSVDGEKMNWNEIDMSSPLVYSESALGTGLMHGLKHVIYVKFDKFNSLVTEEIAAELGKLNNQMRQDGKDYILIGTGRWGSSQPNLGVPVRWEHISQAKVIIESALPHFNIEASQGTHFFQNVTSLGVGYLSLNPYAPGTKEALDVARLDAMPAVYDGEYLRCVEFPEELFVYIDGSTKCGIINI